jgi:hypothetical protein
MYDSYLSIDGLLALTDDVGMFQHTKFSTISRKEGYTTDDNARAFIAALRHHHNYGDPNSLQLAETYIAFMLHMQRKDGRFHNLLGFDRDFKDDVGSEDCMGHALWACGYALNTTAPDEMKLVAKEIFDTGLPPSRRFTSPRAKAQTILGLHQYNKTFPDDQTLRRHIEEISSELKSQYKAEANDGWHWFESYLTYANARLPQALLAAYDSTGDPMCLQIALDSLDFLVETQIVNGIFVPIGTESWFVKGRERSTGICYDGITPKGLNKNQGAEATLSYYLAYLTLYENGLL